MTADENCPKNRCGRRAVVALTGVLALAAASGIVACHANVASLWHAPVGKQFAVEWEDLGPTPRAAERDTPQGMCAANGTILLAVKWAGRSTRVYQFAPDDFSEPVGAFDLPAEAIHTSGLAWDGTHLWAVDFRAGRGYGIDLAASLEAGVASVVGSFAIPLAGRSACTMVPWQGRQLLAISDFRHSRQTVFVDPHACIEAGSTAGQSAFAYRGFGFSQGLASVDGMLLEAENQYGQDVINVYDSGRLPAAGEGALIGQLPAPANAVEDLAVLDGYLYTSDESTFRIYRTRLPEFSSAAGEEQP